MGPGRPSSCTGLRLGVRLGLQLLLLLLLLPLGLLLLLCKPLLLLVLLHGLELTEVPGRGNMDEGFTSERNGSSTL